MQQLQIGPVENSIPAPAAKPRGRKESATVIPASALYLLDKVPFRGTLFLSFDDPAVEIRKLKNKLLTTFRQQFPESPKMFRLTPQECPKGFQVYRQY